MFALMKIVKYPHPALLRPTAEITELDDSIGEVARDMLTVMRANNGVGLAANQIGRDLRIAAINPTGEPEGEDILVNPKITRRSGRLVDEEGCLSFPGIFGKVARAKKVAAHYLDLTGAERTIEAEGFLARILQHELDHLDGVVFISKMTPAARARIKSDLRKLEKEFEH